jgi:hypothetical protein
VKRALIAAAAAEPPVIGLLSVSMNTKTYTPDDTMSLATT